MLVKEWPKTKKLVIGALKEQFANVNWRSCWQLVDIWPNTSMNLGEDKYETDLDLELMYDLI
jgi:hypothetical protein